MESVANKSAYSRSLFGSMSSDSDFDEMIGVNSLGLKVNRFPVHGLELWENFQSVDESNAMFQQLAPMFSVENDQFMHFGQPMPLFLRPIVEKVENQILRAINDGSLNLSFSFCKHWFDQSIVNFYAPPKGIAPHVDLAKFSDLVVVLSLGSTYVMNFEATKEGDDRKLSMPLPEGSMLLLFGSDITESANARWHFTHGISHGMVEKEGTRQWARGDRLSVTLRRLKEGAWTGDK